MTAAEFVYLLAGIAVGVTASVVWRRCRGRLEHHRAHQRVDVRLASVTRITPPGWHPSQEGDSA